MSSYGSNFTQFFLGIIICIGFNNIVYANDSDIQKRGFRDIFQYEKSLKSLPFPNKKSISTQNSQDRMLVFEALAQDLPWTEKSLYNAGIIFQHTNTEMEPQDGEEYRSQEMHLLTFFMLRELTRLTGEEMKQLLGPYRYLVVSGLPKNLELSWKLDPITKKQTIEENGITDEERLEKGFPFKLRQVIESTYSQVRTNIARSDKRNAETTQLYIADQQTRSLFNKNEMVFDRYIERVGDAQRRARLYEMMAEDVLWSAEDLYFAARILQNTPSIINLKSKGQFRLQENHLLAFFLAKQAAIQGYDSAASLMIEAMNQYLKVSRMPATFQLKHVNDNLRTVCQSNNQVSRELWGRYEFPFHLGRVIKDFCPVEYSIEK